MASKPIRFGVIGRSEWLFETLVRLVEAGHIPTFVITAREAPEYTKSAKDFKTLAATLGVPFLRTSRLSSDGAQRFLDKCPSTDCVVSINFSSIISDDVIARYPLGILNAHGGDLPRYRGNACQAWAILAGEPKIAMCIHRMIGGEVDSGDIIARAYLPLNTSTKIGDIYHWFGETIPELYSQALDALATDSDFVLEQQATNKSDALRCYPRRPEDGQINWRSSAIDIVRLVNASGRPFSGAFTFLDDRKVHIFEESSPQASISISASSCGLENGAVEILPFGGTAPYLLAFASQTTRDFSAMEISGENPQRISGLSAGFYELELMDAQGCVDSIQISIDSSQAPRLSYDLIPAQCETATGAIAVLADHGNRPYKAWLNGNPVDMGVMVTNLEVGTYSIMVRDSMNCQDTVFVDLKYDDRFSPPELPLDQVLCEGRELLLNTGLLGHQIGWTHDGKRLLSMEPTIEVRAPGVYEATVIYDQNCAIKSSTRVTEKAIPTTRLERHQTICAGDSLVIPDIDSRYEYSWSNGDVGPKAYFPSPGTYHVEIQDGGYCSQIIPFEILVVEPVNLVGHPQEIWACEGQEVQLLVSGAEEYLWTSADSTLVDHDVADPIVAPRVNGEYLVEGKNQCFSDTMIFSIRIHPVLGQKQDAELFSGSTLKLPDPSENVLWTATGGHRWHRGHGAHGRTDPVGRSGKPSAARHPVGRCARSGCARAMAA